MALRHGRGAGLRRAASRRAGFVALGAALYLAAGAATAWPAILHARSHFLSGGAPAYGEASAGDHLQTLYHYWLVGHQLENGRAPWRDPYSFRPEAKHQPNFSGWPFGIVFWPLEASFGLVGGWNVLQILLYGLAGLLACAWLRELGLPRGPALAGGLAFAIAPYRVQQSVGHLLGPISVLLPLTLWAFERARRGSVWWLALSAGALASIPLSGQVHLALGATPFFLAYAICRTREPRLLLSAGVGVAAAIGAGLLVRNTVIERSTESTGRTLDEISYYSADVGDFFSRHVDHARSEQFVFLGWATPLVALAGLVLLIGLRRFALSALLALGALVPIVLALGTNTFVYSALWHALPPFRFPRVPERLLPIACLCIAALFAFAVTRPRRTAVAAVVAIALLLVDLHVPLYGKSGTGDPASAAPSAPGRLLELPVFDPGVHYGSVYLWYDTAAQRERPAGYSTTAPKAAKETTDRLEPLNCGDWSGDTAAVLDRLGVGAIALHRGLYVHNYAVPSTAWFAWQGLLAHGWTLQRTAGPVWLFERRQIGLLPALPEPSRSEPVFCQGWYGETGSGRYMSETHAPFWIYGIGKLRLEFAPSSLPRRVTVDGRRRLEVRTRGWHLVTIDVPHLVTVPGQPNEVGLKVVRIVATDRGTAR
jgi:hypothetical protein